MHDQIENSRYFAERHRAEKAAAERAASPAGRLAHLELAYRYSLLAEPPLADREPADADESV